MAGTKYPSVIMLHLTLTDQLEKDTLKQWASFSATRTFSRTATLHALLQIETNFLKSLWTLTLSTHLLHVHRFFTEDMLEELPQLTPHCFNVFLVNTEIFILHFYIVTQVQSQFNLPVLLCVFLFFFFLIIIALFVIFYETLHGCSCFGLCRSSRQVLIISQYWM